MADKEEHDLSPVLMSRAAHTLLQLAADYPEVGARLNKLTVNQDPKPYVWPDERKKGWGREFAHENTLRDTGSSPVEANEIVLRRRVMGRSSDIDQVAGGGHPVGANNLESVVTHEFGHIWHEGPNDEAGYRASREYDEVSPAAIKSDSIQGHTDEAPSSYALTNYHEWWAESFSSAHFTPPDKQNDDTRAIGAWLDQEKVLQRQGEGNYAPLVKDAVVDWTHEEGKNERGWDRFKTKTTKAATGSDKASQPYVCPLMDELDLLLYEREQAQPEDPIVKAAKAYLRKYNENHEERGRFSDADSNTHAFHEPGLEEILSAAKQGGGSFRMVDGRPPHSGYMVSLEGKTSYFTEADLQTRSPAAVATVENWLDENRTILKSAGWLGVFTKDGKVYLDASQNVMDRGKAVAVGTTRNQISVWDVVKGEEVPTGGDGEYRGKETRLTASGRLVDD